MGFKILLLAASFFAAAAHAEVGMWTYDNAPIDKIAKQYNFRPTQDWLDKARLSSVRLAQGCSASFVSGDGLIMTNHHCVAACVQQLSTKEKNYHADGFYARSLEDEKKCPDLEANVLTEIKDVTKEVNAATKGLNAGAANDARQAVFAKLEKACATSDDVRCDVVTLYNGGLYNLYRYQRYQDVRLVFAPEFRIAFFGGDPDNFMFPRYDLDVSFIRAYSNNQALKTPNHFGWSKAGAKTGELTFVSGHPGSTRRLVPIPLLEYERDFYLPYRTNYLSEFRGMLAQFSTRGAEQARIALEDLFSIENSLKAFKGEHAALVDKKFFAQKVAEDRELRKRVDANAKWKSQFGSLWKDAEELAPKKQARILPYRYMEIGSGFQSDLFQMARSILRLPAEMAKPNEKRLKEYADARLPELRAQLLSPAPIYKELELEKLAWSLTKLREDLGADHPFVRKFFGKRSPREIAEAAVEGSKLDSVETRKALLEGGKGAVDASKDPMIELAHQVDPDARAIRKQYEDEIEAAETRIGELRGQALFAVYGTSMPPDATFTLRLSYGSVKGWTRADGVQISPFTIIGGAFERATGRDPFKLPDSWINAKDKLNLQIPMDFVTTNDIIGGNSGSPMFNQNREIVGLIFDGNIESLGGAYGFDEATNRAVGVHSSALLEALDKIYGAKRILEELKRN